jgi:hypothetical protein
MPHGRRGGSLTAYGVYFKRIILYAKPAEILGTQSNYLGISLRSLGAEALNAELVVLPEPARLGLFITEVRYNIIHLGGKSCCIN